MVGHVPRTTRGNNTPVVGNLRAARVNVAPGTRRALLCGNSMRQAGFEPTTLAARLPSRHPRAMISGTRVALPAIDGGIMAAPVAPRASDLASRSEILTVAAASPIGTSIEWYDS